MRRPLPVIHESSQYLHKLMKAEAEMQRHSRLHLLYLVKSEHVRSRGKAADILGVHRHTVGAWLNLYQERGLRGLMDIAPRPGAPSPLTQSELRRLRWKLRQPEGFGSYAAIQQWIAEKFDVHLTYGAAYYWAHQKLGAAPKVARPSHIKKKSRNAKTSKPNLLPSSPVSRPTNRKPPMPSSVRHAV